MSHLQIDRLMASRGIDREEALRILGDPGLVDKLILSGDLLPHATEVTAMPGISALSLQSGCDPSREVCPYIGPTSGMIQTGMPGGLVTDWGGLIRTMIDRFLGPGSTGGSGLQQPGPLVLPPGSQTPGLFPPGGLQIPIPPGGLSRGGRAPFITMPNGLPGCPTGYHPEKSGKAYCVRNRRMNPLNPRALSRATRRVGGFARAVKRARTLKKVCRSL